VVNIITSFYLNDLCIEHYESGRPEAEIPSSFKEIAKEAFGPISGNAISCLTVAYTYCILIYGVIRFGDTISHFVERMHLFDSSAANPILFYFIYAGGLITTISKSSNVTLSKLSLVLVLIMFPCFFTLVVPGLQAAQWDTFVEHSGGLFHGSSSHDIFNSFVTSGPLILLSMEMQKIIPSVTKLCHFDKMLSRTSIVVGGLIPPLMYSIYVYMSLGNESYCVKEQLPEIFFIFQMATLMGAATAAGMSVSGEFESLLSNISFQKVFPILSHDTKNEETMDIMTIPEKENHEILYEQRYSVPAVLCAILPPLLLGLIIISSSGGDERVVIRALDFAGGYIVPAFIWIFPALLAWNGVLKKESETDTIFSFWRDKITILWVIFASVGMTCLELVHDFGGLY